MPARPGPKYGHRPVLPRRRTRAPAIFDEAVTVAIAERTPAVPWRLTEAVPSYRRRGESLYPRWRPLPHVVHGPTIPAVPGRRYVARIYARWARPYTHEPRPAARGVAGHWKRAVRSGCSQITEEWTRSHRSENRRSPDCYRMRSYTLPGRNQRGRRPTGRRTGAVGA